MHQENIIMLQDTLQIMDTGFYKKGLRKIHLKLSQEEMRNAKVFLPDDVRDICMKVDTDRALAERNTECTCENIDSYTLAVRRCVERDNKSDNNEVREILVLNFANPVHRGGGVRRGAKAQEEDLCRRSSLLLSLESDEAVAYYSYNISLKTFMGSDAVILSPKVEIIKDENGKLLDETYVVSVLTCAAPMLRNGMEGMTEAEYKSMLLQRINGMLKCAAYWGYTDLILGAWGCGAFRNDARIISDLFYKGLKENNFFKRVDFAVLDRSSEKYNFNEFYRTLHIKILPKRNQNNE